MKEFISKDAQTAVESKLKEFEQRTGCELLLVLTRESDDYPAASWRFGLLTTFILSFLFSFYFHFENQMIWPVVFLLLTLAMTWVGQLPFAKKLALSDVEVARECREKAVELFHTLGTSKVSHKVTAMIMVSELERRIEVLVDETLMSKLSQPELDELVTIMQLHFKAGDTQTGFTQSIQSLEDKILKDFGGKVSEVSPAELKDTIVFL